MWFYRKKDQPEKPEPKRENAYPIRTFYETNAQETVEECVFTFPIKLKNG